MSSLTLSGGGFRATLFHLGVVSYLREKGHLEKIQQIYSVSGGSILAAHLVLNWDAYKSKDNKVFDKAAQQLIDFCRRGVRGRVVRRWCFYWLWVAFICVAAPSFLLAFLPCFSWWSLLAVGASIGWAALVFRAGPFLAPMLWSRIKGLEREYESLFEKKCLRDLAGDQRSPPPELHLLNTDLTTGDPCSFNKEGVLLLGLDKRDPQKPTPFAHHGLPVALGVAASSAYPALFPPVELNHRLLDVLKKQLPHPHQLTDGGVFENLGVGVWRLLLPSGAAPAHLIVSDAQRQIDESVGKRFSLLSQRIQRTTDILMNRVNALEYRPLRSPGASMPVRLMDELSVENALPPEVQRRVQRIRTDLDVFSPSEIQLLVYQGYTAAFQAFEPKGTKVDGVQFSQNRQMPFPTAGSSVWLPYRMDPPCIETDSKRALKDSARNRGWLRAMLGGWNTVPFVLLLGTSYPSLWLATAGWVHFHPAACPEQVEPEVVEAPIHEETREDGWRYTKPEVGIALDYSSNEEHALLVRLGPIPACLTTVSAEIRPRVKVKLEGVVFSGDKKEGQDCSWDKGDWVLRAPPVPCHAGEWIDILVRVPNPPDRPEVKNILESDVGRYFLDIRINGYHACIRE